MLHPDPTLSEQLLDPIVARHLRMRAATELHRQLTTAQECLKSVQELHPSYYHQRCSAMSLTQAPWSLGFAHCTTCSGGRNVRDVQHTLGDPPCC